MNYDHAFHAGGFADVLKHVALVRILLHLRAKPAAFAVLDTHAGAGRYDLAGAEAARGGEWRDGIGRLRAADLGPARDLVAPYLAAVAACNPGPELTAYPGSPALAAALLRLQDRLVACETAPAPAARLARALRSAGRTKAVPIDGWTALNAYLPPQERRGLVVIDPPFESPGEFARLHAALEAAHRKWSTGIFLVWYPITVRAPAEPFLRALARSPIARTLRTELAVAETAGAERLAACGVLVLNPPWTLADELSVIVPRLAEALGGAAGRARVDWLRGEK